VYRGLALTPGQEAAKPAGRFHRYLSAFASVPGIFAIPLPREGLRARAAVRTDQGSSHSV